MKRKSVQIILLFLALCAVSVVQAEGLQMSYYDGCSGFSKRNLVQNAAYRWENGRTQINSGIVENPQADTIRIISILAEFATDQDNQTTGNGKFILSASTPAMIDPPPHDAGYFQNQLTALAEYYQTVSNGKLILIGTVSPKTVSLKHPMGYYNPGTNEEALDKGLSELFRDAVLAADSSGIVFSGFDAVIIFHAGVGKDVDVGYDQTPRDIPSVFLKLEDLKKHLGNNSPSFRGIAVENGKYLVQEGILLPETESQEGYEIGLLGTTVLMFGFQIGLPALWDTDSQRTGIGRWGLMDQGSGNFNGLIPAEPDAFSKVFLGWEKPIEVRQGTNLRIACSAAKTANKIYKVPIQEKEYFLLENRSHDPNGDGSAFGWDSAGNRIQFTAEGGILSDKPFGVIIRVDEYDFDLPGSGILIWHVDENIVEAGLAENKINADPDHRGVDLEEADGAQDIGESYGMLEAGGGSENGIMQDAWYADNDIHFLANRSGEVIFDSDSHPNSRSNSGGNSHIEIIGFSVIDTVMSFSVNTDFLDNHFPRYFTPGLTLYPPLSGDLDGDGQSEIVAASHEGKVFAWKRDGSKAILNPFSQKRIDVSGDSVSYPLALFQMFPKGISSSSAFGGNGSPGVKGMLYSVSANQIVGCSASDINGDGLADQLVDTTFTGQTVTAMIIVDGKPCVGTLDGVFLFLNHKWYLQNVPVQSLCWYERLSKTYWIVSSQTGDLYLSEWPDPPKPIASIDLSAGETVRHLAVGMRDSNHVFITLLTDKRGFVFDTAGTVLGQWGDTRIPATLSAPALGDLDGDGQMEIVTTVKGQVWAIKPNGSLLDYFPVPPLSREINLSSPILGDADGDGKIEVIVSTSEGQIETFRKDGESAEGFPLVLGGSASVTPMLVDLDGDGLTELAAVSEEGSVLVWNLPGKWNANAAPWPAFLHDPGHTASNIQDLKTPSTAQDILPSRLVYNYPNPNIENRTTIRYRLEQPAEVHIRIFNMGGDLVTEINGPGTAQTENEALWDLADVASGIYFCSVTAKGRESTKTVNFKIAVVK